MNLKLFSTQMADGKPMVVVCCECHRARDIHGKWHQVDFDDDAVTISHSYCNECAQRIIKSIRRKSNAPV